MPLDATKIAKLIERAEDVRGMTFGCTCAASPLADDDTLEDLPAELRPSESALPMVRSVIGCAIPNGPSWNYYSQYSLITDPKADFNERRFDGRPMREHGNYRELVAKLLQENPVKNPSCHRVFFTADANTPSILVSDWPIYTGDDVEIARGLLYSLKRLRVSDTGVRREFDINPMIRDRGCDRFEYMPASSVKVQDLDAKRRQKGQLPFEFIRSLFWSMRNAMNSAVHAAEFRMENRYLKDRTFNGYAARVYLAYPLLRRLTKFSQRKEFRCKLQLIAPYIPGMLKSKVNGRAQFAQWVRRVMRRERCTS